MRVIKRLENLKKGHQSIKSNLDKYDKDNFIQTDGFNYY